MRIKLAMLTELSWMSQTSLQSKRNFCGRVLNTILVKVIAAIFDFYSSGRMGRERSTEGTSNGQKEGQGRAGAKEIPPSPSPPPPSIVILS